MIEILTSSPLNTIQDHGRPLAMTLGVSRGGAMDPWALSAGNLLLGNAPGAAAIEISFFPFRIRFLKATSFALTGARGAHSLAGRVLPPDWAMQAEAGDVLVVTRPEAGCHAYLTIAGGFDVPVMLGGRGTDAKGRFGGLDGRGLQKNDRIASGASDGPPVPAGGFGLATPCVLPGEGATTLRVLAAAEFENFTPRSRSLFGEQEWVVTPSANRTGFRLEGETALSLASPLSLMSHGIVPGTVQVPTAGQPIVQMADANTCGGYPKIATVIEQDLRLLAQTRPGGAVRFAFVERAEAIAELRDASGILERIGENVRRMQSCAS